MWNEKLYFWWLHIYHEMYFHSLHTYPLPYTYYFDAPTRWCIFKYFIIQDLYMLAHLQWPGGPAQMVSKLDLCSVCPSALADPFRWHWMGCDFAHVSYDLKRCDVLLRLLLVECRDYLPDNEWAVKFMYRERIFGSRVATAREFL